MQKRLTHFSKQILTILLFALALCGTINIVSAQTSTADLEQQLPSLHGADKAEALFKLTRLYLKKNPNTANIYAEQALQTALATHSTALIGKSYYLRGLVYSNNSDFNKAISYFQKCISTLRDLNAERATRADCYEKIAENSLYLSEVDTAKRYYLISSGMYTSMNDQEGVLSSSNGLAACYLYQGNYETALKTYMQTLKLAEKLNLPAAEGQALLNMGNVYYYQEQYPMALVQYKHALAFILHTNDKEELARLYDNMGTIYENLSKNDSALDYHFKALRIKEEMGNKLEISKSLNNIGNVYLHQGVLETALEYYQKAKNYCLEMNDKNGLSIALINIGVILHKEHKTGEAILALKNAVSLADSIGRKETSKSGYLELASAYSDKKDFENAFLCEKKYTDIKDSLISEERVKSIAEMSTKYETTRKEKELILKESKIKTQQAENDKKSSQLKLLITGLALLLCIIGLIYRSYLMKNNVNKKLEEKNRIIFQQHGKLEEINRDILSSITYAKRIQDALLTGSDYISSALPENFIFYQPRDIISGDFYWCLKLNENQTLLLVADCTGHGVPGAFMSLLGISFMNEIILERKIYSPEKILESLRQEIIHALNPDGKTSFKDGMDCVLLLYDKSTKVIKFSGANNPLWLIRAGKEAEALSLEEFAGDKNPVGLYEGEFKGFRLQTLQLAEGDRIYSFTDGFADQFGGPKGKKFKYRQLADLLLSVSRLPLPEQKKELVRKFAEWKGNLEQVDDILVVGIRV